MDNASLIYIYIASGDNAFKILYADRVFHNRLASLVDKYMQTYTFSLGYTKKEDGNDGFRLYVICHLICCIIASRFPHHGKS